MRSTSLITIVISGCCTRNSILSFVWRSHQSCIHMMLCFLHVSWRWWRRMPCGRITLRLLMESQLCDRVIAEPRASVVVYDTTCNESGNWNEHGMVHVHIQRHRCFGDCLPFSSYATRVFHINNMVITIFFVYDPRIVLLTQLFGGLKRDKTYFVALSSLSVYLQYNERWTNGTFMLMVM